jgi:hypothetical protein
MKNEIEKSKLEFGKLVAALYDEVTHVTSNKSLQASLVYLALQDLRRQYKSIPFISK